MPTRNPARSYRLDPDTLALMRTLAQRLGVTETTVIRLAVRRLAQLEGVSLPAGDVPAEATDGR
jgi:hypothetical protein